MDCSAESKHHIKRLLYVIDSCCILGEFNLYFKRRREGNAAYKKSTLYKSVLLD